MGRGPSQLILSSMLKSLLRLWLATFLILASSAMLLLTDRERPRGGGSLSGTGTGPPTRVRSVAIFQHVSQATLEEGVRGVLAGVGGGGDWANRTTPGPPYKA